MGKSLKKIIAVILTITMITSVAGTSLTSTKAAIDRSTHMFTIFDVLNILKHIVEIEPLSSENRQLYDFYGDGNIDIFNALEVLKWLVWMDNIIGVNPQPNPPSQPQNLRAMSGDRAVALSWDAPARNGNGNFSHYEVTYNNGITWIPTTERSLSFNSLNNDMTYTFQVRAVSSAGKGHPATVTSTPRAPQLTVDQFAAEVVRLTNLERVARGLPALSAENLRIGSAAMLRAEEITTLFSHMRPNGTEWHTVFTQFALNPNASAENIAWGQSTPQAAVNAWMNSTMGHRESILSSTYTHIGVGVAQSGSTFYWVQLFARGGG
ncbi:MAG: CAP domain-containing protein [Oscillospiraceae bacterium]|nr:CAP domain-containing protein [Oscillospiraceae bacterium]